MGISACNYFRRMVVGKSVNSDSLMYHYFNLTRDFVSIQNTAGYETLKSKGLELIKNDSIRLKIISLYEYDYKILRKLEEEYSENQFQASYFKEINEILSPNFNFDSSGNYTGLDLSFKIQDAVKNKLLIYLWKIQINRNFTMQYYSGIKKKVNEIKKNIGEEIKR